jgi:hypothetical protein
LLKRACNQVDQKKLLGVVCNATEAFKRKSSYYSGYSGSRRSK